MRKFTEQEKWILKKIVEINVQKDIHSISLSDICVIFLENEYINIHANKNLNISRLEICFNIEIYNPIREGAKVALKQNEIERKIIDTVFLLIHLKERGLLFEIKGFDVEYEFKITKRDYDTSRHFPKPCNFDKDLEKYLVNLFGNRQYCIRQEFIDFVQNDFKTTEDVRYLRGVRLTWLGIIIAFLIGLTSIIISINQENSVKFDSQQLNHFDSCVNKIIDSKARIYSKDSLSNIITIDKFDTIIDRIDTLILSTKKIEKKVNKKNYR